MWLIHNKQAPSLKVWIHTIIFEQLSWQSLLPATAAPAGLFFR